MKVKQTSDLKTKEITSNSNQSFVFEGNVKMSSFQPIDVKPLYGRNWITNGINNLNYKVYKDAYDDSPTNSSIIKAYVNYIYGEGLIDLSGQCLSQYISKKDTRLIVQDHKIYGGFAVQVIWDSNETDKKPLRIEYIPVYKLGINYNPTTIEVDGYWYSYDWTNRGRFPPTLYPSFTGKYKGNNLEILLVRTPSAEPFFPVPDYISGIPWAKVEGELANAGKSHFKNTIGAVTILNFNQGRFADPVTAKAEADKRRAQVCGSDNESAVIVSFNDGVEEAVVVDQIHPPELNQQNVFYAEEAERKLIVAHSAPPILFQGSNSGSGFSSNADERKESLNELYRRQINPQREVIIDGLEEIFSVIDETIKLDFKNFEKENV